LYYHFSTMSDGLVTVSSQEILEKSLEEQGKNLTVVHFCAEWADQCKQMNDVLKELSKHHPDVKYLLVDAEDLPEISVKYEIEAVPTFIFLKNKQQIGRLNGAHAPELTKMVKEHLNTIAPSITTEDPKTALNNRLKSLINSAECMLFMKGNADEPRCGFSRQMVAILNNHECDYSTFDILQDQDVRAGLKEYSDWKTYPQLYIKGELIGGLDIIKEMEAANELKDTLPKKSDAQAKLNERIKKIINQSKVVLFMKGRPEEPKCGFSRQIVQIMANTKASYTHFDILTDDSIRQGIKVYSDWPTFPQLYVNGELIGGLDIVKEMVQAGEFSDALSASS